MAGKKTGPRKKPGLMLRMPPAMLEQIRSACYLGRKPFGDWVIEACRMRLEAMGTPAAMTWAEYRRAYSDRRLPLETDESYRVRKPEKATATVATAPVGETWGEIWPELKRLAKSGAPKQAHELFEELRAGRQPVPRPDLVNLPIPEAVAWLTTAYPLGS